MSTFKRITKTYELEVGGVKVEHKVELEVPQIADAAEAVQFFGGENELVGRVNTLIERAAQQSANLKFKDAPEGGWNEKNIAETTAKAQELARGYKPEATGGLSKSAKAEGADKILKMAEADINAFRAMTPEQILAMIRGQA